MGSKADKFYFNNFLSATECCVEAAKYLEECLNNYNVNKLKEMIVKMHGFEHKADEVHHEMSAALAKAFVTPLDREDIAESMKNDLREFIRLIRINQIGTRDIAKKLGVAECDVEEIKRAIEKKLVEINIHNIRDYSNNPHANYCYIERPLSIARSFKNA